MTRTGNALRPMTLILRAGIFAAIAMLSGLPGFAAAETGESVRWQMETLAAEQGFRLEGADLIGDETGPVHETGTLSDRINRLLANYNFVVTLDTKDQIAQVTIVGLRGVQPEIPTVPEPIRTEKRQSEHYVEAFLTGPNGRSLPLEFLVDTGASTLVLPRSLAGSLGYAVDQLQSVHVQTANGKTTGLTGTLSSVRVGEAETARVAVTFVDDQLLGGKRLLGMSFLSRFRMTFDGNSGQLHLERQSE